MAQTLLKQYNYPLDVMRGIVKDIIAIYNEQCLLYPCGYLTPWQIPGLSKRKIKTYKKVTHNGAHSIVCN